MRRNLKVTTIIVLILGSLVYFGSYCRPAPAAPQDTFGIVVAAIYSEFLSNPTEYTNLLNVFVRQGVRYAVVYDYGVTAAQISQAKSLGIKILAYVTGLKEPASVTTSGITLWPGGPVIYSQENWAQYDVDYLGNPVPGVSRFLYPADIGSPREVYFSPYGPYVDQVLLPRVNRFIALGADGIFLDTLFLFWDSPDSGWTGRRYGGGESYSKVVWQTRYSSLSFLQFRYKATHDVVQRVYSTIAGRGILVVSNNGINKEEHRLGFASSIDQWQDVADAFVLEYITAGSVPYDPPDIIVYTWILFWKYVMGVSKPIWQLYYTSVDWQFQYMTNAVVETQAAYWASPYYIRSWDSATGKRRSVLTLDFTGSGILGSIKIEGYLYDAFTGAGLGGRTVHLKYALDKLGLTWNLLTDLTTDGNGYYSTPWTPAGHPYNVTAYWDGDSNYNSWRVYEATYIAQAKQEPPYVSPDPLYWIYNFKRYEIQGGIGSVFNSYGLSTSNIRIDTWEPWPWPYPSDLTGWPQQWATYPMQVGGGYQRILPVGFTLDGSQRLPPEAGLTPPAPPTGLTATMVSAFAIRLSWTYTGSSYDSFRIERKTEPSGTYGEIASVPAGTLSYTNIGLAASTTYRYRIRAYRSSDNQYSAYSNEPSATTDVPFQFSISAVQPNPQSIYVGGSATVSFTVTTTQSTPQEVVLTPTNLPQGVSIASFQSYVTPSTTGSQVSLTLTASTAAPTGTYSNLYIQGTGGGASAQSPLFTLNVLPAPLDFTMSTQQTGVTVPQGGSGSNTISVTLVSGTPQTVTLSVSGLPSGASPSFNPPSGIPTFSSTLTITVSSTASAGVYTATVTGVGGGVTRSTSFTLTIQPRIVIPSSSLASNPLGRVFFIFNGKKYYITNPSAFASYGLNWADVKPYTVLNPDNYPSSQINYDYLLDGKMPLPNRPYIAGDVNDGSLYYVPYYTWSGSKYPITWAGYNAYGGYLKTLPIRYGDPAMSLPDSSTVLDGVNPIPTVTVPGYVIGKNPLNRVFFIFNGFKYYFTDWPIYLGYGFTAANIDPSVNPDTYPTAQVRFDYLLEDTSSVFRKPLPNQPYIVGDVNDGSLYWVAYYTYTGEKYAITGAGYNAYGGQLKTMHTRYGDPSIFLATSTYWLDGINPLPVIVYQ